MVKNINYRLGIFRIASLLAARFLPTTLSFLVFMLALFIYLLNESNKLRKKNFRILYMTADDPFLFDPGNIQNIGVETLFKFAVLILTRVLPYPFLFLFYILLSLLNIDYVGDLDVQRDYLL